MSDWSYINIYAVVKFNAHKRTATPAAVQFIGNQLKTLLIIMAQALLIHAEYDTTES